MHDSRELRYYDSFSIKNRKDLNHFLKEYPIETLTESDWTRLTNTGIFSDKKIIQEYQEYLNWEILLINQQVPEDIIEKNIERINWLALSLFQKLSLDFIKKYKNQLSFDALIKNERLLSLDYFNEIFSMYKELSKKKEAISRWEENRKNSFLTKRNPSIYIEKEEGNDNEKEEIEIKENNVEKKTRLSKKKIFSMKKDDLKAELTKRKIKFLYKDNLDTLREKLLKTLKGSIDENKKNKA